MLINLHIILYTNCFLRKPFHSITTDFLFKIDNLNFKLKAVLLIYKSVLFEIFQRENNNKIIKKYKRIHKQVLKNVKTLSKN